MSECYPLQSSRSFARSAHAHDVRRGEGKQGIRAGGLSLGAVVLRVAGVTAAALLVANCAGQVERQGGKQDRFNKKYGVSSSPRVVRPGDPVPKGGGRAMLGKPYTVAGKRYTPIANPHYSAKGVASWYGMDFHGRLTANGEVFDKESIAAAHPTLPLPSYVRVTNLDNGLSLVVRVNDRGPYHGRRVIDVSRRAAELLEFRQVGTARVKVDFIRQASVNGSDDQVLANTLSAAAPARLDGQQTPVMMASAGSTAPQSHEGPRMTARETGAAGTLANEAQAGEAQTSEAQAVAVSTHIQGGATGMTMAGLVEESVSTLPDTAPLPPMRPLRVAAGN